MMQDSSSDSDDSREIKGSVDFGSALASARKFKNYTVEQISPIFLNSNFSSNSR